MMKMKCPLTVSMLAAVALVTSCDSANKSDSEPAAVPKPTNASIGQDLKGAVVTARESLGETKEQFVASAEKKMQQFDSKLTALQAKVSTMAADAKAEGDKAVEALKEQRAKLGSKLDEAKQASQETWREVKAGFEAGWQEIEKGYESLKSKVNG
jgi:DNA repair exonuclease SbcCD ATPase subunit